MPSPLEPPTERRRWSPTLQFYFAREFTVPLVCCILGFLGLFLVTDLLDVLEDLMGADVSGWQIARFFVLRQIVNLVHVLPMSTLLATSFMISVLNRHHEISAVRASGVPIPVCCTPVWLLALGLSLVTLVLNETVVPSYAGSTERWLDRITEGEQYQAEGQRTLAFRNRTGNRHWYFARFNRDGPQEGVIVKQFRPNHTVEWELRADTAAYQDGSWTFGHVALTEYGPDGLLPEGPEKRLDSYTVSDWEESPDRIVMMLRPTEELDIIQMIRILTEREQLPPSTRHVLATTIWYRLSFPFSCLMAAVLGVGFCLTRDRSGALRGFAAAVGFIVLYHFVSQFTVVLGRTGHLPPVVAGSFPTLLFTVAGAAKVWQQR